jgi:hypothetical protein
MINKINNKIKKYHSGEWCKHPRKYLKRTTGKKIRKDIFKPDKIEIRKNSYLDKRYKIKISGNCPFCLERLEKNSKKTRYLKLCRKCKATLDIVVKCKYCNTARIWVKDNLKICKGCGKKN